MKVPSKLRAWFHGPIGWGRCVLLLMLGGGSLALAVAGIDDRIVSHQRSTFVKVPCYIEFATITKEGGRDDRNMPGWQYVPTVRYRYEVDGQSFESDVVCSRTKTITSVVVADSFLQRFGPGASAECYVDPADPEIAMLELPTNDGAKRMAKFGGLVLMLALCGLGALQVAMLIDMAPPRRRPRAPGWGEVDSGPQDALKRTRQMLKERMES